MSYISDRCYCGLWKCREIMVMDWGPHDVLQAFFECGFDALVCREFELTVWVFCRPSEVDVRCHPHVSGFTLRSVVFITAGNCVGAMFQIFSGEL